VFDCRPQARLNGQPYKLLPLAANGFPTLQVPQHQALHRTAPMIFPAPREPTGAYDQLPDAIIAEGLHAMGYPGDIPRTVRRLRGDDTAVFHGKEVPT
jgi:hypothetical protein